MIRRTDPMIFSLLADSGFWATLHIVSPGLDSCWRLHRYDYQPEICRRTKTHCQSHEDDDMSAGLGEWGDERHSQHQSHQLEARWNLRTRQREQGFAQTKQGNRRIWDQHPFFYNNIKDNVAKRIATYKANHECLYRPNEHLPSLFAYCWHVPRACLDLPRVC